MTFIPPKNKALHDKVSAALIRYAGPDWWFWSVTFNDGSAERGFSSTEEDAHQCVERTINGDL